VFARFSNSTTQSGMCEAIGSFRPSREIQFAIAATSCVKLPKGT